MNKLHHDKLIKLAENWEKIADRLDNQPIKMSANSHRLHANELRAVLAKIPRQSWWERIKCAISSTE